MRRDQDYPDIDSLPEEVKYGYKSTKSIWDSDHNWQYTARGTDEAEIEVPRGKVTGGSSAINGQAFIRGIPEDYDSWAEWGNDEWSFRKLVHYFNMVETDTTYLDDPGDFHGSQTGPLSATGSHRRSGGRGTRSGSRPGETTGSRIAKTTTPRTPPEWGPYP